MVFYVVIYKISDLDSKIRVKDISGRGLSQLNFTTAYKSSFDTNSILYNGSTTSADSVYINEGGTYQWTSGNASKVVPVVAGHRVRIEGRELSPNNLTGVRLTSNVNTLGTVPSFLTGIFSTSSFTGDGDFVVPVSATYLYILFYSNVTTTTKITDLDASSSTSYLIKQLNLPNSIYSKVAVRYASDIDTQKRINSVLTKNTYVAINRDSNLSP